MSKVVAGEKLDEELKELERELRREGTMRAGGASPLHERITLDPGQIRKDIPGSATVDDIIRHVGDIAKKEQRAGGSILDRYKDFMSGTNSVTQKSDQTRLIFLQRDLTISGDQKARTMTGTIRPPSGLTQSFAEQLGKKPEVLTGIWGSVTTPFLESPLVKGDGPAFRLAENNPFFLGEPFPITWIEAPGDLLFAIKPTSNESLLMIDADNKIQQALDPCSDEHKQLIAVRAIWLWRSHPDSYCAVLVGDKGYKCATIISDSHRSDPSFYGDSAVHWFLFELFRKLARHGQIGTERVNERFKAGSGKGKVVVKIKDVIHIRAKQKVAGPMTTPEGRTIEWSHRWEVMGHWRKITGVGKDDQGRYHIQGFTWVTPHTKGPEERELVKKTRIYLGPKESA